VETEPNTTAAASAILMAVRMVSISFVEETELFECYSRESYLLVRLVTSYDKLVNAAMPTVFGEESHLPIT